MPKKRPSLRDLAKERPTFDEIIDQRFTLYDEPDRTIAIRLGADIENALENALIHKMTRLSKSDYENLFTKEFAPLRPLGAKIRIAHAFEIIGADMRHDLTSIRLIRNAFAHATKPITFDTPQVADECRGLRCLKKMHMTKIGEYPSSTPKLKFISSVDMISAALVNFSHPWFADHFGPFIPLD